MAASPQTQKRIVTWTAIATTFIAGWEGLYLRTYKDRLAHDLLTVCYGITKAELPDISLSDRFTKEECQQMLADALPRYNKGIDRCIHVPMSESRRAAVVSLAYNVGVRAVCRSTFVKRLNEGDPKACDYMLRFNM